MSLRTHRRSFVMRSPLAFALCAALLAMLPLHAATPEPGMPEAQAKLQAGDAAGAQAILESVVKREPGNGMAWRALGAACIQDKHGDCAEAALHKALELMPDSPQVMYNLGVVGAQRGDKEQAFAWLGKAKATHRLDMTPILNDKDLAVLKDDPRFKALLPTPADFAEPFVEPVKIVREWDGEAADDQFGWIARVLGDVDGDGVPDFVTSAPTKNIGGENAGRVYVYSTKTGKLVWSVDGKPGDQLGTGVESAGDVDGDGIADVAAGAPNGDKAYVYSGKDGHVLLTLNAEAKGDMFGQHISSAGDFDHDGHADVIVGAPNNNAGGKGAGRAYVYSGKDGRLLLTLTGEREGDAFGSTVGGYSDGKHRFLLVGAPGAGPRKTGRVYVYDQLDAKPKFVIESDETGNALGLMFTAVLGDIDGDGVPDIYASDWSNTAKGRGTGRVYVHSGADGHRLLTLTGETAGEGFGTTLAVAGDVDHDGHADLIVGSWQYGGAAVSGGRAYLYSGMDGRLLRTYTCKTPGDTFGFDAVGIGDVDGDGSDDLLITSGWSSIRGFQSGRIFIISSGIAKPKT
ncbi:MAG TPA: FG-GAP-like repeat-containing protein [Xanthomonadaceae bacterium]